MSVRYDTCFADCAVVLPSVQAKYSEFAYNGRFLRKQHWKPTDLNFLDSSSPLFFYPYALYSAGVAANNLSNANKEDNIIFQRNRSETKVVCDSGGYSVATGTKSFSYDGEKTVVRVLDWIEKYADFGAVLDFPVWAIPKGQMPEFRKKWVQEDQVASMNQNVPGLPKRAFGLDYHTCLFFTMFNSQIYVEHMTRDPHKLCEPKEMRFLNVVQGDNDSQAEYWLDAVKHYPFHDWAFAGAITSDPRLLLKQLIIMRDSGLLDKCQVIHLLGNAMMDLGCVYSYIMRYLNASMNRRIQFTYDSANPTTDAAERYKVSIGFYLTPGKPGWSVQTAQPSKYNGEDKLTITLEEYCRKEFDKLCDERGIEPQYRYYASTEISKNTLLFGNDYALLGPNSWDNDAVMIAINHNTQFLIESQKIAQTLFGVESDKIAPLDFTATRPSRASMELDGRLSDAHWAIAKILRSPKQTALADWALYKDWIKPFK